MTNEKLTADNYGYKIQAFSFASAIQSGLTYVPTADILVHLGADVTITVDGVAVPFGAYDKIILRKGQTYTFSVDTALGI